MLDTPIVGNPVERETIRGVTEGYLVTCNDAHCDWQGFFPSAEMALEAVDNHWQHARRNAPYHYGDATHTIVALLDDETATVVDESELNPLEPEKTKYTPQNGENPTFPRTTGDVSELVERGDMISLPPDRTQKVYAVLETRSLGLPTWSVGYADTDADLTGNDLPPRGQNELIARDGEVYCRYGEDFLGAQSFEVVGQAEHQADLTAFDAD